MTQNSAFTKNVRKALIDRGWSLADLSSAVTDRTGLYCDQPYISHVLSGRRNAPKIAAAICDILELDAQQSSA